MSVQRKVPPHATEAERAVLGSILAKPSILQAVTEFIQPEDFYVEAHARIFETMLELNAQGQPVDQVTLRERLRDKGLLEAVGGDEYLLQLTDVLPAVEHAVPYARLVHEKAVVRRTMAVCQSIAARGYGDYGTLGEFLDQAEKELFEVTSHRGGQRYELVKQVLSRVVQHLRDVQGRGEDITGLPTGFSRLDQLTTGLHPGELVIVAGRPGMGKTAFALNVAVNACQRSGRPVLIFSLEMAKEELVRRIVASEGRIDGIKLRTGKVSRQDWARLLDAAGKMDQMPLAIDDTPGISVLEIRAKARRYKAEHKDLGLIVVDYLQLAKSGSRNETREQEISEISRSLKGLAKELSVPVIALSQLNRGVESRSVKDKRPQLSDLRESGAIEQDADTILFVYREEVYRRDDESVRGIAEIIIGKQRAGPTGTVRVRFFPEYTRFDELAEGYDDEAFEGVPDDPEPYYEGGY